MLSSVAEHRIADPAVTGSNPVVSWFFLVGVVGNISACHADARGSIPRLGVFLPLVFSKLLSKKDFFSVFLQKIHYLPTVLTKKHITSKVNLWYIHQKRLKHNERDQTTKPITL